MNQLIVPTKLNEVPLYKMVEYNQIDKDIEDFECHAISIFCDLTISEVKTLPYSVINKASSLIKTLLEEKPKLIPKMTFKGVQFGFIPNLDKISGGEVIDIDAYQKNPNDLYKVMSVLYRPIIKEGQGNRYVIERYKGDINEDFKEMPSDVAFGALLFFWTLGIELMTFTLKSLTIKKAQLTSTDLAKSGDGLDLYISSQMEILQSMKELLECPFIPYAFGRVTKQIWRKWNEEQLIKQ
jgi:hypothetical protein